MSPRLMRVREEPAVVEGGKVAQCMRVEYMVGDHGPFTEVVPKQPGWDLDIKRRMEERAAEVQRIG